MEINAKATNASYADVLESDPVAPVLVAARLAQWFENFPEERFFYHNKEVNRGEFASLFVHALEYKKSNVTQEKLFEKLIKKLRGNTVDKNARLGSRETATTDVQTILRAREYYEKEKKQRFYYPTRGSWNPLDPNTERAPINTEPTGSIRRSEGPTILRDIEKANQIRNETGK